MARLRGGREGCFFNDAGGLWVSDGFFPRVIYKRSSVIGVCCCSNLNSDGVGMSDGNEEGSRRG